MRDWQTGGAHQSGCHPPSSSVCTVSPSTRHCSRLWSGNELGELLEVGRQRLCTSREVREKASHLALIGPGHDPRRRVPTPCAAASSRLSGAWPLLAQGRRANARRRRPAPFHWCCPPFAISAEQTLSTRCARSPASVSRSRPSRRRGPPAQRAVGQDLDVPIAVLEQALDLLGSQMRAPAAACAWVLSLLIYHLRLTRTRARRGVSKVGGLVLPHHGGSVPGRARSCADARQNGYDGRGGGVY
jgi:hypothetical protein